MTLLKCDECCNGALRVYGLKGATHEDIILSSEVDVTIRDGRRTIGLNEADTQFSYRYMAYDMRIHYIIRSNNLFNDTDDDHKQFGEW
jgi:hypothetical protein